MTTNKKKVAIFVDTRKESGGEYQHFLYTLDNIKKNNKDNIDFIVISISKKLNLNLEKEDINYFFFSMNSFERFICYLRNFGPFVRRVKKFFFFKNKFEKFLEKLNVDLVYFTSPSQYSLYLENTKFIISVPDVDHLIYLEFPEFVNNSEFFRRDEILRKSLPRAQAILTNAEIIKKRISKFYSVEENRIYIISLRPCRSVEEFKKFDKDYMLEIEKKFNLPKKYLFYPAMYLPHKNHKSLVDALKILKFDYNLDINIVCTGSDVGYLNEIKEYSIINKVNNNIFFLNFVDNKALPYLYLNSIALIFPVLAGPTFTPPWEAFKMGVPVIFSNILGVKNVYKDAVYYIDPLDSYSIADSVKILLENNSVRENLITRGREILEELNDKNEYDQLFFIIKNYRKIKQTWNFEKP